MTYNISLSDGVDVHFSSAPFIVEDEISPVIAREASLSGCMDIRSVYRVVAKALEFPDYFGENLDALYDCLTDLSWLEAAAYVVVLSDAGTAWTRMPLSMGRMVNTWLDASRFWQEEGIYLKLAFQLTDQDADPSLPVVEAGKS
ncbi:barstar family protein [Luteibacter yeojuensis]